ncbi:hypothetical protein [Planctobacterium marinum]|uniref:Uncharacterized protein n=1 Tax=Planctobacterium marinum TaxID=1631968 RepID=A0AA48KWE7_9ALTE|nr:hypothetical protein MACH26_40010 [Planctobacterium marinum]
MKQRPLFLASILSLTVFTKITDAKETSYTNSMGIGLQYGILGYQRKIVTNEIIYTLGIGLGGVSVGISSPVFGTQRDTLGVTIGSSFEVTDFFALQYHHYFSDLDKPGLVMGLDLVNGRTEGVSSIFTEEDERETLVLFNVGYQF